MDDEQGVKPTRPDFGERGPEPPVASLKPHGACRQTDSKLISRREVIKNEVTPTVRH